MEVQPKIERLTVGWKCLCDDAIGVGDTPESAYTAWLTAFEYKGPPLPTVTEAVINSVYNYERA